MPVRWLRPSPVLKTEHFASFDEFSANDVIGGGTSVPIRTKEFSAARAILPLRDSLLVLQRSFSRHLVADMGTDRGAGLIVPLSLHATVNGEAVDRSMVALMRGKTTVHAIEQHANTYLMLRFNSDMHDIGWPEFDSGLRLMAVDPVGLRRLRATILDLFCWASDCTDPKEFAAVSPVMQQALRAALDSVLIVDAPRADKAASIGKYQRIVAQLDELAEFSPAASFGVDELASRLGVSVRTLQAAVNAVYGVGPYRYLRSRRLWSARHQLTTGASGLTIKVAAQANGFWHMSEFTRAYKGAFGETPSQTLARARRT